MEPIKYVIFDMGQVLLKFTPERILTPWFGEFGESVMQDMHRLIFESGDWAKTDTGLYEDREILDGWIAKVPVCFHAPLRNMMEGWYRGMEPVDGMETLICELKAKGYKTYLLSNTSLRFLDYWQDFEVLRLLDGHFISATCHLTKPDPEIFKAALSQFDLSAEHTFFVDDLSKNIEGAAAVGMRGFCFKNYDVDGLRQALRREGVRV